MSFDSVPTENSTNMVNSGTVYSVLDLKADKSTTYTKTEVDTALSAKADQSTTYTKTEVDTQISTAVSNLVNSAPSTLDTLEELADALGDDPNFATTIATQLGLKADKSDTYTKTEVDTALSNVQSTLTFDNVPTANSDNPVKSSGIKTALDGKQDTLTFDSTPTANSTNPVTSGGIYTALQNVNIDIDDEITEDSDNPVTSAAIYAALQNIPSGGGSGGGGDVQVQSTNLYTGTWNSGSITLSDDFTNYDFIEFVYHSTGGGRQQNYSRIMTPADLQKYTTESSHSSLYGYGNYYFDFHVSDTNILQANSYTANSGYSVTEINGIEITGGSSSSGQGMTETVLFESTSGVTNGTVTLSDSVDNYDLLEFKVVSTDAHHTNSTMITVDQLKSYVYSGTPSTSNTFHLLIIAHGNQYVRIVYYNNTTLTLFEGNYAKLVKIVGLKFSGGGSGGGSSVTVDTEITETSQNPVTSQAIYNALQNIPSGGGGSGGDIDILEIQQTDVTPISGFECKSQYLCNVADDIIMDKGSFGIVYKLNNLPAVVACNRLNGANMRAVLLSTFEDAVKTYYNTTSDISSSSGSFLTDDGLTVYYGFGHGFGNTSSSGSKYPYVGESWNAINKSILDCAKQAASESGLKKSNSEEYQITSSTIQSQILNKKAIKFNDMVFWFAGTFQDSYIYSDVSQELDGNYARLLVLNSVNYSFEIKRAKIQDVIGFDTTPTENSTNAITSGGVYAALQNIPSGSSITVDSTITQGGTNPVEGGAIYTALGDKADQSTTYTKTEVDTALASKGDVTTDTSQNITGTKTFVGSKKIAFKQSAANDKLGFTLYSNSNAERGYLEFNPTNTVDGVAGLMTLGNYATSAASLTQVGFRRYSNISGESGAYNLLMPMVVDARTPFSLTTTYTNFYLPLGFKNGSTIVKTDKSGVVDISSLLASLEARVAALEGN